MTDVAVETVEPLTVVRERLLRQAREDGRRIRAEAEAAAASTLARAEQEATEILEAARTQGEADARAVHARERTRVRRQARSVVLHAQHEAYLSLRAEVHAALRKWRDGPDYGEVRKRLQARAREALGEDAALTEDSSGGVVAEAPGRRVVLSLGAIADRVLDAHTLDLEGLWTP